VAEGHVYRGWPGICGALLFLLWRRSLDWFLAVDIFCIRRSGGVGVYGGLIDGVRGRFTLPGWPTTRLLGGFPCAPRVGASRDDAALADFYAIQNDCAHANQAAGSILQPCRLRRGRWLRRRLG